EKALPELESEKASIEEKLSGGLLDPDEVRKLSGRYSEVQALLDEKETRWLELQL
ncbi:MAG: hypothetical protein IKH49_07180, partial [Bacteroidales bacterium]|nr:hypothetical protein [Bacteroidales bacterium]